MESKRTDCPEKNLLSAGRSRFCHGQIRAIGILRNWMCIECEVRNLDSIVL